jgi:hypothetical protein
VPQVTWVFDDRRDNHRAIGAVSDGRRNRSRRTFVSKGVVSNAVA